MKSLLVPIDPDEPARTRSAIDEVVRTCRADPATTVQLLRVVPEVSGHVAMFFGDAELHELQHDQGAADLKYAQGLLDAAGVRYTSTVLVGRSASTIVGAARGLSCDRIVFCDEPPGLAGQLFGSLANQVRQLIGPAAAPQVSGS